MLWFSITFEITSPVKFLPHEQSFKGGIWHGMFETALGAYSQALLAHFSQGRGGHHRSSYALLPPLDKDGRYPAGALIKWALVLYGDGCQHWHDVLLALLQPGSLKLGYQRTPVGIRQIDAIHPQRIPAPIYTIDAPYLEDGAMPIETIASSGEGASRIALRMITPVNITSSAQRAMGFQNEPVSFARWIKALTRRLSALEPQLAERFDFHGASWQKQEHELRGVDIAHSALDRFEWRYGSCTKRRPIWVGGHSGTVHFAGDISPGVLTLLEFGQWLGIGQQTTWGHGWYRLI